MIQFKKYIEYMFNHKKSSPIGLFMEEEKVRLWNLLHNDLMFPTRRDNIQSNTMTAEIGVHTAISF